MKSLVLSAALSIGSASPYLVSGGGELADLLSSYRFSINGSGCTESNPRFRHQDGTFDMKRGIIGTGVMTGIVWTFAYLSGRSRIKVVRWIGKGTAYYVGAASGWSAIKNIHGCGW